MATVKAIDGHTWQIDEEGVRFFLLEGKDKALLIDSGMKTDDVKGIARSLTDLPTELINTHADRDHTGGNKEFDRAYMHPSELTNYYNSQSGAGETVPVWDGDIIDLGGRQLEIIHIPGHTPGSIAILDKDSRRIFTGDPIQDGRIFMFGVQRELHAYCQSLERLKKHIDRFDEIYPSHGTCPVGKDMIDKLKDAAEKVMKGEAEGKEAEFFGNTIMVYDMGFASFLCDKKK